MEFKMKTPLVEKLRNAGKGDGVRRQLEYAARLIRKRDEGERGGE
jgi:hypothetical protein